ncbi:hypothetical protein [Pseudogemmobacter faecipullorum]|uniref:Uncharacterized protein n=1 Tax=Pseudogemmobacter faecipullorum TaxID=2755041 RepID=A0ABS8CSM7_9RHOB|nr:hypothetical protein [Pseudogemmobacter faecipullorum]MCB5412392.1 hypothetical protein [Pseudogemmobacter faecipullorum]
MMDRKAQLRNVAFGGAWSEQIAGNEALSLSLEALRAACDRTADEDLRDDHDLNYALGVVSRTHPKGRDLERAWGRALSLPEAPDRARELSRIVGLLETGVAARLR